MKIILSNMGKHILLKRLIYISEFHHHYSKQSISSCVMTGAILQCVLCQVLLFTGVDNTFQVYQ